jgi:hypothetical protein
MRPTAFAAALASLLFGTPAFTSDSDDDGVEDGFDNCLMAMNPAQDDTDGDGCGNVCDWDYDDSGIVGFPDLFESDAAFGTSDEEKCHFEPIPGCTVSGKNFGFIISRLGTAPGPSGTTAGTTACP